MKRMTQDRATIGLRRLVVAVCMGSAAGCARALGSSTPDLEPTTAILVVRNHHPSDLRIYVVAADSDAGHRLGIVPRFGAATMVLPSRIHLPASLRFVAMPLGAEEPQVSSPIFVERGMRLVFTVEHAAEYSTLILRP